MNRHAIPDMDLRLQLAERGLECHLLTEHSVAPNARAGGVEMEFPELLCAELGPLVSDAYGRELTQQDLRYETWGITLRCIDDPHTVVACSTLSFVSDLPSYFHTRFEAVEPALQRTGLGRLLFHCTALWSRFLLLNDPLVLDGVIRSGGNYCLVAAVDNSDSEDEEGEAGHGAFLEKLGFVRAQHDFGQDTEKETAYQIAFHVPVNEEIDPEAEAPQPSPLLSPQKTRPDPDLYF